MNDLGEVEMDALIMDGKAMRSGAVGAVSCVKNPIKLARYTLCLILCIDSSVILHILLYKVVRISLTLN